MPEKNSKITAVLPPHQKVPSVKAEMSGEKTPGANRKVTDVNLWCGGLLVLVFFALFFSYTLVLSNKEEVIRPVVINTIDKTKEYLELDRNPSLFTKQKNLSIEEVAFWTNIERENYNLGKLASDPELNKIAKARAEDMFDNQYFAHYNDQDQGAEYQAERFDYQFLTIGENIALGIFKDSKDLVEAWMNSPKHKENILNGKFTSIGVATEKGVFEGKETWIAVQIFARPLSDCPSPDNNLKILIEIKRQQLKTLENSAESLIKQMETDEKEGNFQSYNKKVDIYNGLVKEINSLSVELQSFIDQYNGQVSTFNLCLEN